MPRAKRPAAHETVPNPTERGAPIWLNIELTVELQDAYKEVRGSIAESVFDLLNERVYTQGSKLTIQYDWKESCVAAYLFSPFDPQQPSKTVILSARAKSVAGALTLLLFKVGQLKHRWWDDAAVPKPREFMPD
jgi:hypothetical protein